MNTSKHILLVECNSSDLTQEAFRKGIIQSGITIITGIEEAILFLNKKEQYQSTNIPDVIFIDLDLNDPVVLQAIIKIKQDISIKHIPLIVLSSSAEKDNILTTYSSHVNSYVIKPAGLQEFTEVVRTLENFWLNIVQLP